MIAARDLKNPASVGKFAFLNVLDPGAVHTEWDEVLGFACDRAGVTANALAIIDDESVFHRDDCRERGARLVIIAFFSKLAV